MRARDFAVRLLGSVALAFGLFVLADVGDMFFSFAWRHATLFRGGATATGFVAGFWMAGQRRGPLSVGLAVVMCLGFATFMNGLRTDRGDTNGSVAIHDLGEFQQAERVYQAITGAYGPPECLIDTARCLEGYRWKNILPMSLLGIKQGYIRTFYPGSQAMASSQAPGLHGFAVIAVPTVPGKTGIRNFCGDASGHVYVLRESPPPTDADVGCAPPWTRLR